MTNIELVEWALETLDTNWNDDNAPFPALIHRDDAMIYTRSDGVLAADRPSTEFDLKTDNAVGVSSAPDRVTTPAGFGYDEQSVEDGVSVRVEAAHERTYGHVTGSTEFQALVDEAKRAILAERQWPREDDHTLTVENEASGSHNHRDYFEATFDVFFDGYEDLP